MSSIHNKRRKEYNAKKKKKERQQRLLEETASPQLDVQGAPYASSFPVDLNLADITEQARKARMLPSEWADLRKNEDQPKDPVFPPAQVETANATPDHMSAREVVVAPASSGTRGTRMLNRARTLLDASPPQPQPAAANTPRTMLPRAKPSQKPNAAIERNVIRLRRQHEPKLDATARTFCVLYIAQVLFTHVKLLSIGGFGKVYTALWHNANVVIKMFTGQYAEKNACCELGQVQLGRASWSVVSVEGYIYWKEGGKQTPCLVYKDAGNTLWSVLSDPASPPLVSPLGLCAEICEAVHSLHKDSGMLHLDVKGDNVTLYVDKKKPGRYVVRLIDMGMSQPVTNSHNGYLKQKRDKSKERHWFAPEWGYATCFTASTDTWAVAHLLADVLLPMVGGRYHKERPPSGGIAAKFGQEVEREVLQCFCESPRFRPALTSMITLFNAKK
jgi:hypothetical protein